MNYKKILTIQDISCVGQCSLTVALPILSACGVETAILPSAVLSTHTAFSSFTFNDLTDDMPVIEKAWIEQGIKFDGLYTGYLGSVRQMDIVKSIKNSCLNEGAPLIVDPAMADNGKLYVGFDDKFVEAMRGLVAQADICLPNITEACLLTGTPYTAEYDEDFLLEILEKLSGICSGTIVMTGACPEGISLKNTKAFVSLSPELKINNVDISGAPISGAAIYGHGKLEYYLHPKRPNSCHGTGDVFASAFSGAIMNGHDTLNAAKIAADYVLGCIDDTAKLDNHWYGAAFEPGLGRLAQAVKL